MNSRNNTLLKLFFYSKIPMFETCFWHVFIYRFWLFLDITLNSSLANARSVSWILRTVHTLLNLFVFSKTSMLDICFWHACKHGFLVGHVYSYYTLTQVRLMFEVHHEFSELCLLYSNFSFSLKYPCSIFVFDMHANMRFLLFLDMYIHITHYSNLLKQEVCHELYELYLLYSKS